MAAAYFTHNNAWDSIVIPDAGQYLPIDANATELRHFMAEDTGDFLADWSGREMAEGEDAECYGDVIATRDQDGPLVILDAERWAERLAFHHITTQE